MRRLAAALLALVLGTTLAACGGSSGGPGGGAGGSSGPGSPTAARLPDVTLQPLRSDGKPVDLGELRGPTVVSLWAQWCGPCRAELPKYEAFHRAHPDVDVLGVDWQDTQRDRALALADRSGLTYPLVTDPDRKIAGQGLPQLILVDARGKIAYREFVEITSTAQLEGLVRKHLGVDL